MMDNVEVGAPHKTEQAKSLFAQQSVRGWWPCSIEKDGKKALGVSMNRKYADRVMNAFLGKLACSDLYYWGNEWTTMGLRLEWRLIKMVSGFMTLTRDWRNKAIAPK